jgi:hypothetical protein
MIRKPIGLELMKIVIITHLSTFDIENVVLTKVVYIHICDKRFECIMYMI